MIIGYARTSTVDQRAGLEAQIRDLQQAGCERIWSEQVSSVAERAQLDQCLAFLREGDVLTVCKPDRLARSTSNLLDIVSGLEKRRIGLVVLSMGGQRVDTASPTGKLMLTMLGAIAEFERNLMLERQREGIARAAAEGKYKGRAPTARDQSTEVIRLLESGLNAKAVVKQLHISESSVYRIQATHRAAQRPADG